MPEWVIFNTSPLLYLHRLRQLDILQALYQQIVVPNAVRNELHVGHLQGEDTPELAAYNWITIRSVQVPEALTLMTNLGAGEAQVLAMALEEPGSLVLLERPFCARRRSEASYPLDRYGWCATQGEAGGPSHSGCPVIGSNGTDGISVERYR